MREINTPTARSYSGIDIFQFGKIRRIELDANDPVLFPDAVNFGQGGAFLFYPGDVADLELCVVGDGDEVYFPIPPGFAELAADHHSEYRLRSVAGGTIRVAARKES